MADFAQIIGRVGSDPVTKSITAKGEQKEIVTFRVVAPVGLATKDPDSGQYSQAEAWFDVAVFSDRLKKPVLAELYRGAKVGIEGSLKSRVYNEKTYYDLSANRIFITQDIVPQRTAAAPAAPAAAPAAGEFEF